MPKKITAFFITLLLLAGALAIAGFRSAPKLRSIQFMKTQITELANQQIVLTFNQKITHPQLQIKPVKADIPKPTYNLIALGKKTIITVDSPLFNNTKYQVTGSVAAAGSGNKAQVNTTFTTAAARLVTLVPGVGKLPDKIVQYQIAKQPKTLFKDNHILEFNHQGNWLVALTAKDANYNQLVVLNPTEKIDFRLTQPRAETSRQMQFSLDNTMLGIKYFNGRHDSLRFYPLSSLRANAAIQLNDNKNSSIPVAEWSFNQKNNLATVKTQSGAILLFDPLTNTIKNSSEKTHKPRSFGLLNNYYLDEQTHLINVNNKVINSYTGALFYAPAAASSVISGFCVSPNKQYVAVAVQTDRHNSQFAIINMGNRQSQAAMLGTLANWCAPAGHEDVP